MSLSVSYNQINSGIDTLALKEVAKQIFQRADAKTSDLSKFDLTKFNRVTLGTDLYSGKVDASTANQIAITKSGMQVNLSAGALASLSFLNAQASKVLLQSVDGKIIVEPKETFDKTKTSALPSFGRLVETADLDSDKRDSNPFYRGELLINITDKKEKEEVLNIFA